MEKKVLIDKYGRQLNYLRLSVTDRCNFRCYYCMPEEGVNFAARKDLLTLDEMYSLSVIFSNLGVSKIRITGGEPFVRAGIMRFIKDLSDLKELDEISITTNATFSPGHIAGLQLAGIKKINVSLDSLNSENFYRITRRDSFEQVYQSIFTLLEKGFEVKINCVVSDEKNNADIIPFIELTRTNNLSVRFLEEMPFNGKASFIIPKWNYKEIYKHVEKHYLEIDKEVDEENSTSINYRIPGYAGSFGIIPSFSRTFCGTCNRIRLSATGELRTCLYGPASVNLRDVVRQGASVSEIENEILEAVTKRSVDGFEAEVSNKHSIKKSMSALGG
jgi:molybdenum cofactor biosynthesis protein A